MSMIFVSSALCGMRLELGHLHVLCPKRLLCPSERRTLSIHLSSKLAGQELDSADEVLALG